METFTAEYRTPYGMARSYLVPETMPAPELARDLATTWVEIAQINPTAVGTLRIAIGRFSAHMNTEIGFQPHHHALGDVRRRHIDSWEASLLKWQIQHPSDHPYRVAVHMYAFLRYIEDTHPGTLHPEVNDRVRQPTRLSHIRNEPLRDFPDDELTAIKAAVRNLTRPDGAWIDRASADVILAFHVALSISTGEPPEVLRGLTMDDIIATSVDQRSAGMSTEEIAGARLTDSYLITLRKNRAHTVEEVSWDRRQNPVTVRYLDSLIALTEPLRRVTRLRTLWMIEDDWGRVASAPWRRLSFSRWLTQNVAEAVSPPHDFRRLRKTAIAADVVASAPAYLRTQRQHSTATFFDHYTNSPRLRQHAGELFVASVSELYERAVGPTIDTGDTIMQLDTRAREVLPALTGELPPFVEGALSGCRDPKASPHAPLGEVCPMSRAGTCFTCPNAVITVDHLPALVLVNAVSAPDAAVNLATWQNVWGDIHDATTIALQMFPRDTVNEARMHTDEVLVDLGLRHEMRGSDDEPIGA